MTRARPTRALALLVLPLVAACAAPAGGPPLLPGLFVPRQPEPELPPPLPLAVQEALPPGVSPSIVLQDAAGCYLYSIERTDPPSGYPLRDAAGNPICGDGATALASAPVFAPPSAPVFAPPSAPVFAPAAAPTAPVTLGAPVAPATVAPVAAPVAPPVTRPVPPAVTPAIAPPVTSAPLGVGAPPAAPGALVPGDITPPAPIAPLGAG